MLSFWIGFISGIVQSVVAAGLIAYYLFRVGRIVKVRKVQTRRICFEEIEDDHEAPIDIEKAQRAFMEHWAGPLLESGVDVQSAWTGYCAGRTDVENERLAAVLGEGR